MAGYLVAWGIRKGRRAAGRMDDQVDEMMDAALDRLHDVVADKLTGDPALEILEKQASEGQEPTERLQRRVNDAVADHAEANPAFDAALQSVLVALAQSGGSQARASIVMNARASGEGRVFQAGHDQHVTE